MIVAERCERCIMFKHTAEKGALIAYEGYSKSPRYFKLTYLI